MAQRLATEYVHASLKLSLSQMMQLIEMFSRTKSEIHVKVLETGSQQMLLGDNRHSLSIDFRFDAGYYHVDGSYRFTNIDWTNVMRQAIRLFKGDAVVHRIYQGFTMIYHYERGHVTKIVESSLKAEKVIYEYKDPLIALEHTYRNQGPERVIDALQTQVNQLLDVRNRCDHPHDQAAIDAQLSLLVHKLFVLEA